MHWRRRRRSGVRVTLLCLLSAIALAIIGSGRAIADDPKGLEFVDATPATMSPGWKGTFTTNIAIRNNNSDSTFEPTIQLKGGERCKPATTEFTTDEENGQKGVRNGEIKVFKLKIFNVSLPATCYLELQTYDNGKIIVRSVKQFKLSQRFVTGWVWLWLVLTIVASVAAILCAIKRITRIYPEPASARLGSPAWDFSKSWTSTLTLAGGIVAAALAVSSLPELTQHASKAGYGTLVLLFSALALLAPLPYLCAMRGEVREENKTDNNAAKKFVVLYGGSGRVFFITCFITLVAGLGQIAVLGLLIDEIFQPMLSWFCIVSSSLVVATWIQLFVYSVHSMWLTFALQKKSPEPPTAKGLADSPAMLGSGRPSWPLL